MYVILTGSHSNYILFHILYKSRVRKCFTNICTPTLMSEACCSLKSFIRWNTRKYLVFSFYNTKLTIYNYILSNVADCGLVENVLQNQGQCLKHDIEVMVLFHDFVLFVYARCLPSLSSQFASYPIRYRCYLLWDLCMNIWNTNQHLLELLVLQVGSLLS